MKAVLTRTRPFLVTFLVLGLLLVFTVVAQATPYSLSPANGARISSAAEVFSWLDNSDYGPVDHWYLEISTDPLTDSWGYFWQLPVYASPNLHTSSVNLNAIGRSLAPGTYYWHVVGFYGPSGSGGTAWSLPVSSFTVYNPAASAPVINVSPASLSFTAAFLGSNPAAKSIYISNKGTGTLYFSLAKNVTSWLNNPVFVSNNGQIAEYAISVNTTGLPPGIYNTGQIGVWETSNPSNLVTVPVTLQVFADATAPNGTIAINNGATYAKANATLKLAASDGGSGVDKMSLKDDGGTWSNWFDYVATTPWHFSGASGSTKKVWAQFKDKAGNVSAAVSDTVILDNVAPSAVGMTAPALSTSVSKTKVFGVSWSGATDAAPSSGISYDVMYRSFRSSTWRYFKSATTARSGSFTGSPGNAYLFRVRSRDNAGNVSGWSATKETIVPYDNNSAISAHSGFDTLYSNSASSFYMGTVRYSTVAGQSLTYRFSGKSVNLIGTKGASRSKAKIYIDGNYIRTVEEYSASARYRQVIYTKAWSAVGTHTIKIVNLATSGRTRFDVDGLGVER